MTRKIVHLTALAMASAVLLTGSASSGGVELGRRYIDPLNGFSLRPPAGAERVRETSPARLATWRKRDPKRGAILYTLGMRVAEETSGETIDIKPFSRELARKLGAQENYRIQTIETGKVDGKDAVFLAGTTRGVGNFHQRQVWILTKDAVGGTETQPAEHARFLVLVINGPADMAGQLKDVADAVVETVEITDPRQARILREQRLERGAELLGELTDKELRDALADGEKWLLMVRDEKPVGYMRTVAERATVSGAAGVVVRSWVVMNLPDAQRVIKYRRMFTTADRSFEKWREVLQLGEGTETRRFVEEGMKQAELIVCTIAAPGGTDNYEKQVPLAIYLPRALADLFPRLVDLTESAGYAFATYSSDVNSFDLRTFVIVGEDRITVQGRRVDAIKITDRLAEDVEPSTLWVDEDGGLLKVASPEGITMLQSSRGAVTRRFPDARQVIGSFGD